MTQEQIDEFRCTLDSELGYDQRLDDNKQNDVDKRIYYCAAQFEQTDDKLRELEKSLSVTVAAIASAEVVIATLSEDTAALDGGIIALDKILRFVS